MIDDSIIQYFLRMQGKNIGVRLDPQLEKLKDSPTTSSFDPSMFSKKVGNKADHYSLLYNNITAIHKPFGVVHIIYCINNNNTGDTYTYVTDHPMDSIIIDEYENDDGEWVVEEKMWPSGFGFFDGVVEPFMPEVYPSIPMDIRLTTGDMYEQSIILEGFILEAKTNPDVINHNYFANLRMVRSDASVVSANNTTAINKFTDRVEKGVLGIDGWKMSMLMVYVPRGSFVDIQSAMVNANLGGMSPTDGTLMFQSSMPADARVAVIRDNIRAKRYMMYRLEATGSISWWRLAKDMTHATCPWPNAMTAQAMASFPSPFAANNSNPKVITTTTQNNEKWYSYEIPYLDGEDHLDNDEDIIADFHEFILSSL